MENILGHSEPNSKEPCYTIGTVARITGVSAYVLRMWERRYGVVTPLRTQGNHRLYSDDDINRLRLIEQARTRGHPIGTVARLTLEDLARLATASSVPVGIASPEPTIDSGEWLACSEAAARAMDFRRMRESLLRAHAAIGTGAFIEQVVTPLMEWVGEEWETGRLRIAQEHLVTAAVRTFLATLMVCRQGGRSRSSAIVVSTPTGQLHEIGALLAATVACEEGWRVVYVGPDLPASEIAGAVLHTGAQAVALSIVYPLDDPFLVQELETLRGCLTSDIPVIVGGRGAMGYLDTLNRIQANPIVDMALFRNTLRDLQRPCGSQLESEKQHEQRTE